MMQPSATGMVPPPLDQQQQQQQQQYQYQQQPPQQPSQQPPPPQPYMMMPPAGHPSQAPPPPQMWAAHQPLPAMPQQAAPGGGGGGGGEVRTLWIGDLQYWMDEAYLATCFAATGEVANVKVIRNKQTMQPEGYGFIEFYTRAAAERVLQTYNGAIMPNGGQSFRLNWASAGEKRADDTPDYTIFVGDLASDVTDYMLQEMFRGRYPSVRSAKVVMDRLTSRTKGYGFVKFGDESEQIRAMSEMNGVFLSTRPMRIGLATNKKIATGQQYQKDPNVTDDHLRQVFGQYGEIVQVKIPPGKRCGFVQFADRSCAEEALRMLNGTQLGGQNIRLSWGRSPANKQPQSDPSQYGGYYGYAAGYENYGYGAASQDANMYYGGYAGYANYQQPQQQQQQQQQLGYS